MIATARKTVSFNMKTSFSPGTKLWPSIFFIVIGSCIRVWWISFVSGLCYNQEPGGKRHGHLAHDQQHGGPVVYTGD